MKERSLAILVVCVFTLFGCENFEKGQKRYDPFSPQVTVVGDKIEVAMLVFLPGKSGRVTWHLDRTSGYTFPENGIEFEGEVTEQLQKGSQDGKFKDALIIDRNQTEFECPKQKGGAEFSCINKHTRPGIYKYTIRVRKGDTKLERDPPAVNW